MRQARPSATGGFSEKSPTVLGLAWLSRILLAASRSPASPCTEDLQRLSRSLHNLRKYTDVLVYGRKVYGLSQDPASLQLHWEGWDHAPRQDHAYTQHISRSEYSSPKHEVGLPPHQLLGRGPPPATRGPAGVGRGEAHCG